MVVGLKFLQRPPRGNAVREHHGLANLKTVQFAEQARGQACAVNNVAVGRAGMCLQGLANLFQSFQM